MSQRQIMGFYLFPVVCRIGEKRKAESRKWKVESGKWKVEN